MLRSRVNSTLLSYLSLHEYLLSELFQWICLKTKEVTLWLQKYACHFCRHTVIGLHCMKCYMRQNCVSHMHKPRTNTLTHIYTHAHNTHIPCSPRKMLDNARQTYLYHQPQTTDHHEYLTTHQEGAFFSRCIWPHSEGKMFLTGQQKPLWYCCSRGGSAMSDNVTKTYIMCPKQIFKHISSLKERFGF